MRPSLRLTFAATALVATLAATGCMNGPRLVTPEPPPIPEPAGDVPAANKAVLEPGTQVVADTAAGHIKIEAGPGLRRVFDWDGLRRGAIVKPREELFAGESSKGLYFDGKPTVWKPADGITKLRYEEGYRDFDNIDDAMIWMQIRRLYYTYNDNGLAIGWRRKGDTLQVELWQFTIDGEKPTFLPDSNSDHIAKGPLKAEPQKMYPHLVFADGHTEPYNTNTASEYSGAHAGGTTSHCNWFKNLFGQCTTTSADTLDSTADSNAAAETSATASTGAAPADTSSASGLATNGEAASSAADDNTQSDADTGAPRAKIAGDVVNIRSRPTTHSDVLLQVKAGDSVAILKKDRGWRYVKLDDGRKGWVADFLLKHQE
ncbi:SH3 domain-containing protein [Salinisphaera sp.]|uniref:SH3 domain-containing protein n=1 Tax=Salinisphaera sp. TaxID=1914330 RepID=UPI002D76D9AA|nr:SH3 domain-containing protein [Salinisphaera sp.]